jgi:2-succinyl-5-enolpyruvyl-6-hydroxy-3-cyclohexene-1-carboxylate synthase
VEILLNAVQRSRRGLFLLGAGALEHDPQAILSLAERLGWPILVDARGIRREPYESLVVHSDGIVRSPIATETLLPDLVVRVGAPHIGRPMEAWLATLVSRGVPQVLVDHYGRFEEPSRAPGIVLHAEPAALFARVATLVGPGASDSEWLPAWRAADDTAEAAIAALLGRDDRLTEPGIARRVVETAPAGATLFASSSMPIRDLEWFAQRRAGAPRLIANRGANGIDGVTSTMLGVAATTDAPMIGLIGDLAFLHDLSGLVWGEMEVMPPATLVVIDNAGGGIFNFLAYPDQLTPVTFERAFGTPQRTDLVALAGAFGIPVTEVERDHEFDVALRDATDSGQLSIVLARTERRANVALHGELNAAIVAALESLRR